MSNKLLVSFLFCSCALYGQREFNGPIYINKIEIKNVNFIEKTFYDIEFPQLDGSELDLTAQGDQSKDQKENNNKDENSTAEEK